MDKIAKSGADMEPVLVSKPDSCRILGGICMRTLENMINSKKRPVRRIGRRTFIPYSALVKFGK